jgi:NADPH:quinone reductase-like Zn-dependent oxidoreductase
MKAMQVNDAKRGAVLVAAEIPRPKPSQDEVLIQVHAAGVTHTELLWSTTTQTKEGAERRGAVPGHEFSGVVAARGANVRSFEVGDEVYGMNDWFTDGALAEFCVTLPHNIAKKPATLNHETAASVPISALTAWQGLLEKAKIQRGERVLVHGGAGAVGLFAVQFARLHGAYVITTVSARDLEFVKQIGADEAIDYREQRFEEHLRNVDAVFDTVGGDTFERSWNVVRTGGRVVTIAAEFETSTDPRVKNAYFIVEPDQKQLVASAKLLDERHLKAFVKAIVPLKAASAAYSGAFKLQDGHGKIVVAISEQQL